MSVVICTYTEQRWSDLVQAVESSLRQSMPPLEVVIVVDYNPAMAERSRAELPGARIVENTQAKGLSGARNTGIANSSGALITFLDDDAAAEDGCFQALAARCADPRVLGAGGYADPLWSAPRPAWFPPEFDWVVGCTHKGSPSRAAAVRNLWGNCMCIKREVFEEVGGFTLGIGRQNEIPLGCEDTELCIRARKRWPDRHFIFEPAARISHRVPAKRVAWSYFSSRCYAEGFSKARIARMVGAGAALSTESSYVGSVLPRAIARGLSEAVLHRDRNGLLRAAAIVAGLGLTGAGYVRGTFGASGQ